MNTAYKSSLLMGFALLLKLLGSGLAAVCAPLLGFFAKPQTTLTFFGLRTALALITGHFSCYIPTLAGSLVLSTQSRVVSVLIPLTCMGLFILHPIGSASWLYTLYWLIPIGLSTSSQPSIFTRALISTYTTHAVGSVIWLYTHVTTPVYWHTLIAQVWFERLAYAGLLTGSYYVILYSINYLRKVNHVKTSYPLFSTAVHTSHP